jgi:hypothetical protein
MSVWVKRLVLALLVLFVMIQFIRPSRANPPVNPKLEINASQSVSPAVESIFLRSCNDCHSNRTVWPWYSNVAPASWLVAYDVNKGRSAVNLSEWATYPAEKRNELLKEICKEVSDGEMPGIAYTLPHPVARLTDADVQTICQWTQAAGQRLSSENE